MSNVDETRKQLTTIPQAAQESIWSMVDEDESDSRQNVFSRKPDEDHHRQLIRKHILC